MDTRIEPKINFYEVDSHPYQQTLSYINAFVLNTVTFMNKFSSVCETKLSEVCKSYTRREMSSEWRVGIAVDAETGDYFEHIRSQTSIHPR